MRMSHKSTPSAALISKAKTQPSESPAPKVASAQTLAAYRDILAVGKGLPKAVRLCWKAVASMLPEDGPAAIDYRDIRKRAHCDERHAIRAIAFGVAVGCIERERSRKHSAPGSCWWNTNRYRWLGPPSTPIIRGSYSAFLASSGSGKSQKEENRKSQNPAGARDVRTRAQHDDVRPAWEEGDAHRVIAALNMGGRCKVCRLPRPTGRCRGPR